MRVRLTGGRVLDPTHGENGVATGATRTIEIADGRLVEPTDLPAEEYDLGGDIVMAGGIDLHSHIAGGKMNLARLLMQEDRRAYPEMPGAFCGCGGGRASPSAHATGCRYAELGYTTVFEPAMVGSNARGAHLEMADIPNLDTGAYLVLGSDDYLQRLLATGAAQEQINAYVGWMVEATQAYAIKIVNPGGINAFKFNARKLDLDEANPHYGNTPRKVLQTLIRAVTELNLPHPIHLHGCNLGVPGNDETTIATIAAAEGRRLHLTHLQFHSYGTEGDKHFSSSAARIAEMVNANPNISVDVGQVMFGQTITASADYMSQYRNRPLGSPKKSIGMDIELDAGCGVVPFEYRDRNFVNALQWAIGLELFLLVEDPWRIFLTTDHPNGGPFTTYPHLIRLLMDRDFRNAQLATLNKAAQKHTLLPEITREYSLEEIAILTRAAPARILNLKDKGHLRTGGVGDVVVHTPDSDAEKMFSKARYVFKNGTLIVKDGEIVETVTGTTHVARPQFDRGIEKDMDRWFDEAIGLKAKHFRISDGELRGGAGPTILKCERTGS
ncbi:formylmethanofuran dehydrogenase subunit A [Ancylobacter sp. 6x-1]|uniref:Formylmethanofuran dehydrogenase subunit A n=1 Tax=Ancylobacter crimeensis TaxID=2579147 RepID=A0ABT0D8M5_9HYPH|nr:formylmethanofuran dehydrogenase subunit A [Ancylobacter crimeensis]MCK0196296.1 formylmethanofuran dehydrogenase subunit A [Ancylobacter crimeensis]